MINILIPMVGKSQFFNIEEYPFPKPFIEINGKPMIQTVIENLSQISSDIKFVFVVNSSDCLNYHIDDTLALLTDNKCEIIKSDKETRGAACTCLLAIKYIKNKTPLIISNADQIFSDDLVSIVNGFKNNNYDAGVICFNSVHPRWSYIKTDSHNKVIETAEKRPISKNAICGFYYFKEGNFFVDAAMESIKKDSNVNGLYYIAPTLNEMILQNKEIGFFSVKNENYHTFYSPQKIEEFQKKTSYQGK